MVNRESVLYAPTAASTAWHCQCQDLKTIPRVHLTASTNCFGTVKCQNFELYVFILPAAQTVLVLSVSELKFGEPSVSLTTRKKCSQWHPPFIIAQILSTVGSVQVKLLYSVTVFATVSRPRQMGAGFAKGGLRTFFSPQFFLVVFFFFFWGDSDTAVPHLFLWWLWVEGLEQLLRSANTLADAIICTGWTLKVGQFTTGLQLILGNHRTVARRCHKTWCAHAFPPSRCQPTALKTRTVVTMLACHIFTLHQFVVVWRPLSSHSVWAKCKFVFKNCLFLRLRECMSQLTGCSKCMWCVLFELW